MEIKLTIKLLSAALITLSLVSCSEPAKQDASAPADKEVTKRLKPVPMIDYTLVASAPHDKNAFTEGFLFHNGKLYESTGAPLHLDNARSLWGIVDEKSGKIDVKAELDRRIYFGEGITVVNEKLYQLTYTTQVGFIYDANTYQRLGQFNYKNKEGWGLTTDGKHLIMSDGTYDLTFLDPQTFAVVKTLPVTESGFASDFLNELEYINGYIYANVWTRNFIVKIDPATGEVVGKMDLTPLFNKARNGNINLLEMNGIAYDPASDRILVTGKFWPEIYQISFPH